MVESLYHRYEAEPAVSYGTVRAGLHTLNDGDVSASSPVSGGAEEVAVSIIRHEDTFVDLHVEGHDGDWTKTSEQAVRRAVQRVGAVGDLVESEGGYETET